MDGHTPGGRWKVTIELSKDQVDQLVRSMQWAKMMDSHEDIDKFPQRLDVLAHRVFLEEILDILYKAVMEEKH